MFHIQPSLDADRPFFGRVEGLRGLGAMAVAGFHLTGWTVHGVAVLPLSGWGQASNFQNALGHLGRFMLPGHAFLMAFFVISGFVLRLSLGHGPRGLRAAATKFTVARLFRFFPIVFFAVFISAMVGDSHSNGAVLTARQLISNMLLFDVSMNRHLWALQVEILMMPIIFSLYLIERGIGSRFLAAVAVSTSALSFSPGWAGWPPLSNNLFAFVFGMLVPTLGRQAASTLSLRSATTLLIACLTVSLSTGGLLGPYSRMAAFIEGYTAFFVVSVIAYRPDVALMRPLDFSWLRRLGTAAGSYYVLHMATAPLAMAIASTWIPAKFCIQFPGLMSVLVVGGWLLALAPIMILISKIVEEPGIALGRRVIRYFLPQRTPVIRSIRKPSTHTLPRAA